MEVSPIQVSNPDIDLQQLWFSSVEILQFLHHQTTVSYSSYVDDTPLCLQTIVFIIFSLLITSCMQSKVLQVKGAGQIHLFNEKVTKDSKRRTNTKLRNNLAMMKLKSELTVKRQPNVFIIFGDVFLASFCYFTLSSIRWFVLSESGCCERTRDV